MAHSSPSYSPSERLTILIVAAVQFINVMDSTMVLPMGPFFAAPLGIPVAQIGLLGVAYVLASCVSGLLGSLMLDRFPRRPTLGIAMIGLVAATAMGGLAVDMFSMIAIRIVAGLFGGVAAALSFTILADGVAEARRGGAMGTVTGTYSLTSVIGIPIALLLCAVGGWRLPFFGVAVLGAAIGIAAYALLPRDLAPEAKPEQDSVGRMIADFWAIARRPITRLTLVVKGVGILSSALLIPNLATFLVYNLGYPEDRLGVLWMVGGVFAVIGPHFAGRLSDRIGGIPPLRIISVGVSIVIYLMFVRGAATIHWAGIWIVLPLFAAFFGLNLSRVAIVGAMVTKAPPPEERGRFMSLASTFESVGAAGAMVIAASVLTEGPGGAVGRMDWLAGVAILTTLSLPFLAKRLDVHLRRDAMARSALGNIAFEPATRDAAE
jgi:predicted MFS family arabinose efflux permease